MTVLYIDTEHDDVRADPALGPRHQARIAAACARLADAAGEPCLSRRAAEISPESIDRLAPASIVISGNTTDWCRFDDGHFAGLLQTIRVAPVPILGICAGHQLIGHAHGAPWGPIGPLQEDEIDPYPEFSPGQRKERGFLPIAIDPTSPLFRDLDSASVFFQSHYWHLERAPDGFAVRAHSPWSPVQAIERLDRPVFGVQFHPERADAIHSHGSTVLRNFLSLQSSI
ncbi:MAG: type 1 glutamine amidotransferase [Thermomicrobiales bacterium]